MLYIIYSKKHKEGFTEVDFMEKKYKNIQNQSVGERKLFIVLCSTVFPEYPSHPCSSGYR
jgi:hypothetical protein